MQEGRILAACHEGAYVLRLVGDVRVTLCTTIEDYLQKMYEDPGFTSVWVDLTQAEGLDSTTLGVLAQLALNVNEKFGFKPAVFTCDPGIVRLLQSMSFDRLYDIREEACVEPADITQIPSVSGSQQQVRDTVIEAHRVLMGLSEDNRERFQDLMNTLERA